MSRFKRKRKGKGKGNESKKKHVFLSDEREDFLRLCKNCPSVQHVLREDLLGPTQNTGEWFEYRRDKLTASKIHDLCHPPIAGASNPPDEEAMAHGTEHEAKAREVWAKVHHKIVYIPPAISARDEEILGIPEYCDVREALSASADGITSEGDLIEIKCPYRAEWQNIKKNPHDISERYRYQIQFSLHVLNLETCHLIRYLPPSGNARREFPDNGEDGDFVVTTIRRQEDFFAQALDEDRTIGELVSHEAKKLMKKKYIVPLDHVLITSLLANINSLDYDAGEAFREKFASSFTKEKRRDKVTEFNEGDWSSDAFLLVFRARDDFEALTMTDARKYLSKAITESRRIGVVTTIQVLSCCNDGFHPGKDFAHGGEAHREFSATTRILHDEFYAMAGDRASNYDECAILVCNFLQVGIVMRFLSGKDQKWITKHVTKEEVSFPQSEHFKISNKDEKESTFFNISGEDEKDSTFFKIPRDKVKDLATTRVEDFGSLVLPLGFELHLRTSFAHNLLEDVDKLTNVFALQMPHPTAHVYNDNPVAKEDYHRAVLATFNVDERVLMQRKILPRRTRALSETQKANVRKKLILFVEHMQRLPDDDTSARFKLDVEQIKVVEKKVTEVLAGHSTLAVIEPCRTGKTRITLALVCLLIDIFLDDEMQDAKVLFVSSVSASAFPNELTNFCAEFSKIGGMVDVCKNDVAKRVLYKTMTALQVSHKKLVLDTVYAIVVIDEVHETYSLSQHANNPQIASFFGIAENLRGNLKICVSGTPLCRGVRDVFFLGRLLEFDFSQWGDDEHTFVNDCASQVERLLMAGVEDQTSALNALTMLDQTFFSPCVARVQNPLRVKNKIVYEFDRSWFDDDGDNGDFEDKAFVAPYDSTALFLDKRWNSNEFFVKAFCARLYGAHPQLALNLLYQYLSDAESELNKYDVQLHDDDDARNDDDDARNDDDNDDRDFDPNDGEVDDDDDDARNDDDDSRNDDDDDDDDDATNEQIDLLKNSHMKWSALIRDIQQAPTASLSDSYVAPARMSYVITQTREHMRAGRKVVITCEYLSVLEKFRQLLVFKLPELQTDSNSTILFDAAHFANSKSRTDVLMMFDDVESAVRVLFVSSSIGSAGISFNVAHELINLQVSWKPSLEAQMSHRLSSHDAENNIDRCVTTLVTSLADFTRHISFLVCAETAILFNVGGVVCSDKRFENRLRVPWFLTRLNEKTEKESTFFLRAFLNRCVNESDGVTVTRNDTTVRLEMNDEKLRNMLTTTPANSRPAKRFAGRGRAGGGGKGKGRGVGGGGGGRKQRRTPKNTDDSASLVARVPPSEGRRFESNIQTILSMLDRDVEQDNNALAAHITSVDKALQTHFVSILPDDVAGIDVVKLYSKAVSENDRNSVIEYSRLNRIDFEWYSQYVCAESHFFPASTIKQRVERGERTNRQIDEKIDFLSGAMTDAALLLLCESTGYKLVAPFRSDMAFMSLKFKIFCTPAGVAFDPVSEKLFLIEVHVDSMLDQYGVLDSECESFRLKRTDLIYSLEIFGLEHGILVSHGFDRTSAVRTMRLVYVTRDSAVEVFGEKKNRVDEETALTPAAFVSRLSRLSRLSSL